MFLFIFGAVSVITCDCAYSDVVGVTDQTLFVLLASCSVCINRTFPSRFPQNPEETVKGSHRR